MRRMGFGCCTDPAKVLDSDGLALFIENKRPPLLFLWRGFGDREAVVCAMVIYEAYACRLGSVLR